MYIQCSCGNDTFRITVDLVAECTKCGKRLQICKKPEIPELPEPLPPKLPKYWFKM